MHRKKKTKIDTMKEDDEQDDEEAEEDKSLLEDRVKKKRRRKKKKWKSHVSDIYPRVCSISLLKLIKLLLHPLAEMGEEEEERKRRGAKSEEEGGERGGGGRRGGILITYIKTFEVTEQVPSTTQCIIKTAINIKYNFCVNFL